MMNLLVLATLCYSGPQDGEIVNPNGCLSGRPSVLQDGTEKTPGQEKKEQHRFVPERVFQVDKLQRVKCKVGEHVFYLWVMDTDSKRSEGMMHLKKEDFKNDEGMIFAFSNVGDTVRRFWMRNTLVDLDICYCDQDGIINSTYTMKALDEVTDYSSKRLSMFVIELRDGTLNKLKIKEGMKFEIPEDVVSRDDSGRN